MFRQFRILLPVLALMLCASSLIQAAGPAETTLTPRAYLPLLGNQSTGQPAPPPTQPEPKSSEELINAAVQSGAISAEMGTVYKVFAVFGDARLPAQYHGADKGREGSPLIAEASEAFASMSPENQAIVAPFLLAPSNPQSWFAQGTTQRATRSTPPEAGVTVVGFETPHLMIWYDAAHPEYKQRAITIGTEIESTIWPKLTGLMGREPLADCGAACPNGGDDARLDIYMVPQVRSFARTETSCAPNSGFIVLEYNEPFSIVAHEFMHVVEFAFSCNNYAEYDWLFEATAQWAMDYVYPNESGDPDYPDANNEQGVTSYLFKSPALPLGTTNDAHEYAAYLFLFFLSRGQNNPGLVRDLWDHATMPNSLDVLDTLSGGFKEQWPKFALYNLNTESVGFYYNWDKLWAGVDYDEVEMGAPETKQFATKANHLSAN